MTSRQELYDRIRESSRKEVIREEMIKLGFWTDDHVSKTDKAEFNKEIAVKKELEKEFNALRAELGRMENQEAMLRHMRKQRLIESKRKQQETRERRERERQQRAEAWQQSKQKEIIYLGESVSAGLSEHDSRPDRLDGMGLPHIEDAAQLASLLGISVGDLRFLSFHRKCSRRTHYQRFQIPKKTGGTRLISAPMPRLKTAQYGVLEHILNEVPVHDSAHGFRSGRSIVSNAEPHVGRDLVINLDLQDFFPTISWKRIKGMYRGLGYGEAVATILALLCSEPETDEVVLDEQTYYVARGERHLPQGAPTSPAITNIICRRLDRRLSGLAQKFGYAYTRYADDLTFSASGEAVADRARLIRAVTDIIQHEGFQVHPKKTRILQRGARREVTGIVVNDKLSVNRKMLKKMRAVLYRMEKDGLQGITWEGAPNPLEAIEGYAHFVKMVRPELGTQFLEQIGRIKGQYNYKPTAYERYGKQKKQALAGSGASSTKKSKPWWKFW